MKAPVPMSADALAESLELLHWPQRTLATILGVDESTVRRWQRGDRAIPQPIADWLRKVAAFHAKNPPPVAPDRPARGRPPGGSIYAPREKPPE
jgi:transcriptional regulator with XRE-family HTH domain